MERPDPWRWGAAVVGWNGFLFWMSSARRDVPLMSIIEFADKLVHAGAFAWLCFLVLQTLRGFRDDVIGLQRFTIGVVITGCMGVLDELHQAYVPGRSSSFYDALANVFGAMVMAALYEMWRRKLRLRG